jgi:translocon-associated protein subunit beta
MMNLQIQNKYLVEGMDTVVKYSLYNIGEAAAVEIQLTESGFSAEDFDLAGGNLAVQIDRMAPKANNSFTV